MGLAAKNGHLDTVMWIRDNLWVSKCFARFNDALRLAVENADSNEPGRVLEIVKYLCEKYPDMPTKILQDATCVAAGEGNVDVVKYLITLPNLYDKAQVAYCAVDHPNALAIITDGMHPANHPIFDLITRT